MEKTILEVIQQCSKASPVEYGVVVRPKLVLKNTVGKSETRTPEVRQGESGPRSLADGILTHLREARKPTTTSA